MTMFVINGFYMKMREKYTAPGKEIFYYTVEWDPATLSWEDFRQKVLGATNPAKAAEGSIRNDMFKSYKALGLASEPNIGDNGVHASASPFEGMCERLNWIAAELESDPFGKALLAAGMPKDQLLAWTKDPQVKLADGSMGSIFDALEDMDAPECLAKAKKLAGVSGGSAVKLNSALVFIKPHAISDSVKKLVEDRFAKEGIKIISSGALGSKKIDEDKLIDNHYYAIANKAANTTPKDLNPPENKKVEFKEKWGLSWEDALAQNNVYNSVEACAHLGINGDQLNTIWRKAEKKGKLLKFGGGFYCGELDPNDLEGGFSSVAKTIAVAGVVVLLGVLVYKKLILPRSKSKND